MDNSTGNRAPMRNRADELSSADDTEPFCDDRSAYARVTHTDSELHDDVGELATLVAQLAAAVSSGDAARISLAGKAAEELADRLFPRLILRRAAQVCGSALAVHGPCAMLHGVRLAEIAAPLALLTTVFVVGTVGYVVLGFSWLDALYQTVTTVATVGFREVQPLDTAGKVFTVALILVGVGTALYTFSVVLEMLLEGHLSQLFGRRRMDRKIASMRSHVILCGWGRVGRAIGDELAAAGTDMVVVDIDSQRFTDSETPAIVGDATEDRVLERAGLGRGARWWLRSAPMRTTSSSPSALVLCGPISSSSHAPGSRRPRRSSAAPVRIGS